MTEIWKDVEGYEGCYQVSNFGRVKSLGNGNARNPNFQKERIMKASKNKYGYFRICLCKDGKHKYYSIHRLVAIAFIPNPNNLPQVNHKDECKTNNRVDNLEWCSVKYNMTYATRIQRFIESDTNNPKKSKKVLCIETGVIYPSTKQVEREFGFSHNNISYACSGKYKQAYGFHWKYID